MSEITVLVQTEGSSMRDILKNGGYMVACALGSLLAAVLTGYLTSTISAKFSRNVRKKLFNKVEDLSIHETRPLSSFGQPYNR